MLRSSKEIGSLVLCTFTQNTVMGWMDMQEHQGQGIRDVKLGIQRGRLANTGISFVKIFF